MDNEIDCLVLEIICGLRVQSFSILERNDVAFSDMNLVLREICWKRHYSACSISIVAWLLRI